MSLIKQVKAVGALLQLDCGDNSCYFQAMGDIGPRTNGGCRCDLVSAVQDLIDAKRIAAERMET